MSQFFDGVQYVIEPTNFHTVVVVISLRFRLILNLIHYTIYVYHIYIFIYTWVLQ